MEYPVLAPSPFADHSIIVFNLACINAVDLLATLLLTDPSGRAVVLDGHLSSFYNAFMIGRRYVSLLAVGPETNKEELREAVATLRIAPKPQ